MIVCCRYVCVGWLVVCLCACLFVDVLLVDVCRSCLVGWSFVCLVVAIVFFVGV